MFSLQNFSPRLYQSNILKACIDKNCLIILPTGIGKTGISLLLAIERLNKFPDSRILFCSPTKPLCQQHKETFSSSTNISKEHLLLYTGLLKADLRQKLFPNSKVVIATPQTIESDIRNNCINLEDFSLLVIDEAHRSRMKYASTLVAKKYMETAKNPRILALTASPGSTKEKIKEICENLFIDNIEVRTDTDEDVIPYLQNKSIYYEEVHLTNEFEQIKKLLRSVYTEKLKHLRKIGFTKPPSLTNKRDLIMLQMQFQKELSRHNPSAFFAISLIAGLLKLSYLIELIETQSLKPLQNFFNKLSSESTKAAKSLMKTHEIIEAKNITGSLIDNGVLHPKLEKLILIIKKQLSTSPHSKIIIFANYRDTISEILEELSNVENCKPIKLIGHKDGITQKQQLETISRFESNEFNCLITTSIGEEGLSIGTLDTAIFYDNVPSAIRRIQREGRVARIKPGKIIYLIVKNSMDSAYHWKARKDEKIMKTAINNIKNKLEEQESLAKYESNS